MAEKQEGAGRDDASSPVPLLGLEAGIHITRRAFLITAGALASKPVPGAIGAELASSSEGDLEIAWQSTGSKDLVVRHPEGTWELPTAAFGPNATLSFVSKGENQAIKVARAQWPGSRMYSLALTFAKLESGRWQLRVETNGWPEPAHFVHRFKPVDYLTWLKTGAELEVQVAPTGVTSFCETTLDGTARSNEPATLRLNRDFSWTLRTARSGFVLLNSVARFDEFTFRRSGRNSALQPVGTTMPRGPSMVASASACVGTGNYILGHAGSLQISLIALGAFKAEWRRVDYANGPMSLDIRGPWRALIETSGLREGPFVAEKGRLTIKRQKGTLLVSAELIPQAHKQRFLTTLCELTVQRPRSATATPPTNPPGSSNGATPAQTESGDSTHRLTLSAKNGVIQHFGGLLPLQGASLKLPGSDFSFLEFVPSLSCRLMIDGVPSDPDPGPSFGRIVLGKVERLFLPLDSSRLRVARTTDLLSLTYGFRGLALDATRDGAAIVRNSVPNKDSAEAPSEAVIVVEFPSQHVAERAYFRTLDTQTRKPISIPPDVAVDRDAIVRRVRQNTSAKFDSSNADDIEAVEMEKARRDPFYKQYRAEFARTDELKNYGVVVGDRNLGYVGGMRPAFSNDSDKARYEERVKDLARRVQADIEATILMPNVLLDEDRALARQIAIDRREKPDATNKIFKANEQVRFDRENPEHVKRVELQKEQISDFYRLFRERFSRELPQYAITIGGTTLGYIGGREPLLPGDTEAAKRKSRQEYGLRVRELVGRIENDKNQPGREAFDSVTPARLSAPTRLALRVPESAAEGETVAAFDIDALLDWSSFGLSVTRRAQTLAIARRTGVKRSTEHHVEGGPAPTFAAQLAHQNIQGAGPGQKDTWQSRMDAIAVSISTKPHATETAIELPFRLTLSPDQNARWYAPLSDLSKEAKRDGVPLWHVELDEEGRPSSVRAVWSPDFRPNAFWRSGKVRTSAPPRGPYPPWRLGKEIDDESARKKVTPSFRATLDAYDRHELVGLTSIHGLPVLARRLPDKTLDGSQLQPPEGFFIRDLLDNDEKNQAIYLPKALEIRELALSALGGSLNLDTPFEPPAAPAAEGAKVELFDAFSVERWRHRTVWGRDIEAEVVYKGFLFPIGIRCSLVKLTERRFMPHPVGGYPTAFLVQRMFLRIGKPDKHYPAIGQANGGRAWPVETLRLLTRRTPDIVDPTTPAEYDSETSVNSMGRVNLGTSARGLVFWPRTQPATGAEVLFEVQIDENAGSVQTPLIFVDNVAAHHRETVAVLTQNYNDSTKTSLERLRTIDHSGTRRRYAAENNSGENTHTTMAWVLEAEGRAATLGKTDGKAAATLGRNDYFEMDAILEGADQPPFYPVMQSARVRLAQVERLIGTSAATVKVTFDPLYILVGFDETNVRELYLQVEDNDVQLRFAGRNRPKTGEPAAADDEGTLAKGDRAGAVGQPNANVDALSRRHGPVGDARVPSLGGKSLEDLQKFNPASFFNDARLLGFNLAELLYDNAAFKDQAPKLREIVEYGAGAGAEADAQRLICEQVITRVKAVAEEIRKQVGRQLIAQGKVSGGSVRQADEEVLLRRIYPDLGSAVDDCVKMVDDARSSCKKPSEQGKPDPQPYQDLGGVYESGRRLVAALRRAADDPLAPIREEAQKLLRDARNEVPSVLADTVRKLAPSWNAQLVRDRIRQLASDPQLIAWRRLVFSLPVVMRQANLTAVGARIDELLAKALRDTQWRENERVEVYLKSALSKYQKDLGDALDQAATATAGEDKAELEGVRKDLERRADGILYESATLALNAIAGASDGAAAAMKRLDGSDLHGSASNVDIPAALNALLEALGMATAGIEDLARALFPITPPNDACDTAARALYDGILAVTPDQTDADENTRVCAREALAALRALGRARERARTLLESPGITAKPDLKEWIAQSEKSLGDLIVQLRNRTNATCEYFVAVTSERKRLGTDAAKFSKQACSGNAQVVVSHLTRIEHARTDVLTTVLGLFGELRNFLQKWPSLPEQSLGPDTAASIVASVREIAASTSLAVATHLLAALPWLKDTTLLGVRPPTGWLDKGKELIKQTRYRSWNSFAKGLTDVERAYPKETPIAQAASAAAGVLNQPAQGVEALAKQLAELEDELRRALRAAGPTAALSATQELLQFMQAKAFIDLLRHEAAALELVAKPLAATEDAVKAFVPHAAAVVLPLLELVLAVDKTVDAWRSQIKTEFEKAASGAVGGFSVFPVIRRLLKKLFGVAPDEPAAPPKDALQLEVDDLTALIAQLRKSPPAPASVAKALSKLTSIAADWREYKAPAAAVMRAVGEFGEAVLRGDLGRLIDLDTPRRMIEEELKNLIPRKVTLTYDFKVPKLKPNDYFKVIESTADDFILRNTIVVDLFDGSHSTKITGELQPFEVNLIGEKLPVVTLVFSTASFSSIDAGKPTFNIQLRTVVLREKVKFLQQLQSYMSPKEGSGFFLNLMQDPPGIEAGYKLAFGVISFGNLSFINVALWTSCALPFDNRKPLFRVSLSRRESPFLISAAPYGGGGFLALESDGSGITAFEASFEYGGVGAFGFGPLEGVGRITTGIYVRQSRGEGPRMEGLFFCGGSAHIACFGMSTSLSVRLSQQENTGDMFGKATYAFSFSLGLTDIEYKVTVWKQEKKPESRQARAPDDEERILVAMAETTATDLPQTLIAGGVAARRERAAARSNACDRTARREKPTQSCINEAGARLVSAAACQGQDWQTYLQYFDLALTQKV